MNKGTYFVRVFVEGKLIPTYQYLNVDQAVVNV